MITEENVVKFGVSDNEKPCAECQKLREDFGVTEYDVVTKKERHITKAGKIILGVFGATFVGVTAATLPFVLPALRKICLPFVPATTNQVQNVLKLLEGRSGKLVDLGSGDGRIVIEAARRGFHAEGIELNPWLVWYSRYASLRARVSKRTAFHTRDLWKADLSSYNNVVIFGVEQMMPGLESKLRAELASDGVIIACRFPLPGWPIHRVEGSGIDTVWLYTRAGLQT